MSMKTTIVHDSFCSRLAEGCATLHPRLRCATAPAELSLKNVADVMACGSRVCSRRRNVSDPALRGAARPNTSKNQNVVYYRKPLYFSGVARRHSLLRRCRVGLQRARENQAAPQPGPPDGEGRPAPLMNGKTPDAAPGDSRKPASSGRAASQQPDVGPAKGGKRFLEEQRKKHADSTAWMSTLFL